jgi:hypothetical protein
MNQEHLSSDDFVTLPGAALNDQGLLRVVETGRLRVPGRCQALRVDRQATADLPTMRYLLAQYPWQQMPYRIGRWVWAECDIGSNISWFRWYRTYDTFQLLHPGTGMPIGEFAVRGKSFLRPPGGMLWFAGDPVVAGTYLPDGGDLQKIRLAVTLELPKSEALREVVRLEPGRQYMGLPLPFLHLPAIDERRPWLAHQPERPPKRRR